MIPQPTKSPDQMQLCPAQTVMISWNFRSSQVKHTLHTFRITGHLRPEFIFVLTNWHMVGDVVSIQMWVMFGAQIKCLKLSSGAKINPYSG